MTSSPDNPIMKDLLNEDKLKKAMAQSIQDQKKLSPDNTVEHILDNYGCCDDDNCYPEGEVAYCQHTNRNMVKSLDSHYLSIFLELVGEPEKGMESKITKTPNGLVIDEWGDIASGFRNALRQELRTALQDRLGEK